MKTCTCCGHASAVSADAGRLRVQVDDELLALCNQAYDAARDFNSASVEIAHVVWCLTRGGLPERRFQQSGFERARLEAMSMNWIASAMRSREGNTLSTSQELKLLLARSERVANADGRGFASQIDFLAALSRHAEDLSSAQFATGRSDAMTSCRPTASEARESREALRGSDGRAQLTARGDAELTASYEVSSWNQRHQPPATPAVSTPVIDDDPALAAEILRPPPHDDMSVEDRLSEPQRSCDGVRGQAVSEQHAKRRDSGQTTGPSSSLARRSGGALRYAVRGARTRVQDRDDAAARSAAAADRAELVERLRRQEQLVDELSRLVGHLVGRRERDQDREREEGPRGSDMRSRPHASSAREAAHGRSARGPARGDDDHPVRASASRGTGRWDRSRLRRWRAPWGQRAAEVEERSIAQVPAIRGRSAVANDPAIQRHDGQPRYRTMRNIGLGLVSGAAPSPDNDTEDEDTTGERPKRFYLSPDDEIVKAPSIGPRTAAKLNPAGIVLVRDLLRCDPEVVAARTNNRYITADRIACWKAQARLVCTIPWLRGTHAQLLVGAGYDTLNKLVRADTTVVCAGILRFAATREGQSILRTGPAPEIDRIACWIENAALAEPARAA